MSSSSVVAGAAAAGASAAGAETGATTTGAATTEATASAFVAFLAATFFSTGAGATGTRAGTGASTAADFAATFLATLGATDELIIPVVGVFVEDILRTTLIRGTRVCQFLDIRVDFSFNFLFLFSLKSLEVYIYDRNANMRLDICSKIYFYVHYIFSTPLRVEEMGEIAVEFRKCANIKSKNHPDSPCKSTAVHGDFCARHWKRPHRYVALTELRNTYITRKFHQAVRQIQDWWRRSLPSLRYRQQGPSMNLYTLSQNTTEVYSMEPLEKIPRLFFFSYSDSHKNIWSFDIRSLSHILAEGKALENPYTREAFTQKTLQKVRERVAYLRKRKYPVLYLQGDNLSQEQEWNQRVLDVFMKLESLGYSAACSWFHSLTVVHHNNFYKMMFELWNWRLGLSSAEKELIVPGHMKSQTKLFRWQPEVVASKNHNLRWWQKHNLWLIQTFIEKSQDKGKNALGAVYIMMGIVHVSDEAAEAYPWIVDTMS